MNTIEEDKMQGPLPNHAYNSMPIGTGLCVIGDIPINFSEESGAVSSISLNININSFGIDGLEMDFEKEYHFGSVIHIPIKVENDFNGQVSISMILDDRMDNWYTLYRYGRTLLSTADGHPENTGASRPFRQNAYAQRRAYIPYIEVRMGDGSEELRNVFKFKHCYLKSLGKLPVTFGSEGMVTFDASFVYDDIEMKRLDINEENPNFVGD